MDFLSVLGIGETVNGIGILLLFVAICAFGTSIIVEGLKVIPAINSLPTKLVAYLTALVLTPSAFVALMAYLQEPVEWFAVFASFLAAFLVAKVSMGGWDDVTSLWQRCKKE